MPKCINLLLFEVVPESVQDTFPEMAEITRQLTKVMVDYMRISWEASVFHLHKRVMLSGVWRSIRLNTCILDISGSISVYVDTTRYWGSKCVNDLFIYWKEKGRLKKKRGFIGLTEITREKFWKFESRSNLDENNFEI